MSDVLEGLPVEKLTTDEENAHANASTDNSREALILYNLREAFFYSKSSCSTRGLSDGEILSACYDALTAAARRFKPNQIRFLAYAKADIRGSIYRAFRSLEVVKKVRGHEPLPEPSDGDAEDQPPVELVPRPTKSAGDQLTQAPEFDQIYTTEEWAQIQPLFVKVLNDKERMILELNFRGGLNLQQIGDLLNNTSRSDVHHTKQTALKKLRHALINRKRFHTGR